MPNIEEYVLAWQAAKSINSLKGWSYTPSTQILPASRLLLNCRRKQTTLRVKIRGVDFGYESQISPVPRGCLDVSPEAHA